MDKEYQIDLLEEPAWNVIGSAIHTYNMKEVGDDRGQTLCFVLRAPDGEIVGGVIGATHWDWLHIDLMWVKEELRGCGYGRRLLALIEQEGRQRGAKNAYLDTFSFQAPGFYAKLGYRVFGTLTEFPSGHQRCFLTKALE